jgi:glycerophosphoryl diester phosphodiesterase
MKWLLTFGLICLLGARMTVQDVEWVAHRGESADAPENTLAAFKLAWERGVKAIELDVHLSADGALVVSHDADTKRTTGVEKKIKETDSRTLLDLDAGRWKDPRWAGEKLPLLDDALATIPDGSKCYVEVKVGPEAIPALVDAVRRSGKKPEQLVIISFEPETVAEAKRKLPEIQAYFLSSPKRDEQGVLRPTTQELIAKAKELGADGLDLAYKAVDAQAVQEIKAAGLGIYVWTVDKPEDATALIKAGVDGITSNHPAWLMKQVEGR